VSSRRAQSAVFDAMIFFIFILIASGILMVAIPRTAQPIEHVNRESAQATVQSFRVSILASTINETSFQNSSGKCIFRNYAVDKLLLEDLLARKRYNLQSSAFNVLEGAIKEIADALIKECGYKYRLEAQIIDTDYQIIISDYSYLPEGRFASMITLSMPDGVGLARFALYIWK